MGSSSRDHPVRVRGRYSLTLLANAVCERCLRTRAYPRCFFRREVCAAVEALQGDDNPKIAICHIAGMHHARDIHLSPYRTQAHGCCYVNDVVLAIRPVRRVPEATTAHRVTQARRRGFHRFRLSRGGRSAEDITPPGRPPAQHGILPPDACEAGGVRRALPRRCGRETRVPVHVPG